jgi:hypothetical protein
MLIAVELLALDKPALIRRVEEEYDELGAALLPLASARDAAETLRDFNWFGGMSARGGVGSKKMTLFAASDRQLIIRAVSVTSR